jgi:transglutaminase-like putative cysteine protease
MLLEITHTTHYRFDGQAHGATQYLRMTPTNSASQRVHNWALSTPEPTHPWWDGHGNRVDSLTIHSKVGEIELIAHGLVETFEKAGVVGEDGPAALPPDYWLRSGPYTAWGEHLDRLLAAIMPERPAHRLDVLHQLMRGLIDRIPYQPGMTEVGTTANEAAAIGAGVCQDHAHLFCTLARALNIPARYVSGYLLSGPISGPQDVSHAWAEAYVPSIGWVGFDASNGICPTEHYVRVAIGVDYADGCPVRGVRTGGGREDLTVSVSVAPMETLTSAPYNPAQQQQ